MQLNAPFGCCMCCVCVRVGLLAAEAGPQNLPNIFVARREFDEAVAALRAEIEELKARNPPTFQ